MKGVQCRSRSKEQCRDVQADFVCKLEKERVDAFEVYPNTVRLNLLNGCPSRSPLRFSCISSMITDGFLIFQSILRERKIPRQQLRILYVFCEYTRRQTKPGLCRYPQVLRQQLTQKASQGIGREKGWVGELGRQQKGPSPFSLSPFFSLPLPPPPPPPSSFPICYSTKAITICPSIHSVHLN